MTKISFPNSAILADIYSRSLPVPLKCATRSSPKTLPEPEEAGDADEEEEACCCCACAALLPAAAAAAAAAATTPTLPSPNCACALLTEAERAMRRNSRDGRLRCFEEEDGFGGDAAAWDHGGLSLTRLLRQQQQEFDCIKIKSQADQAAIIPDCK